MKKVVLPIFILAFFLLMTCVQGGTVIVEVYGIKEIKGNIVIGLYNKQKGFPDVGKQYKGIITKIKTTSATYTFSDVPDGNYAIALFQDANSNGKLDYNFLGIPKELYAFSCITKTCLKTPEFHEARFKLKDKQILKLKLK
jgi:uncharacterized protein (DUF2141 family)